MFLSSETHRYCRMAAMNLSPPRKDGPLFSRRILSSSNARTLPLEEGMGGEGASDGRHIGNGRVV